MGGDQINEGLTMCEVLMQLPLTLLGGSGPTQVSDWSTEDKDEGCFPLVWNHSLFVRILGKFDLVGSS